MPWLRGAAAKCSNELCMAYEPRDVRQWWAHVRSSLLRCALRAARSAAVKSWLAAATPLRADESYGLQSISRRAAWRHLAAVFTADVNQLLVMKSCVYPALPVNISVTADATRSTPCWSPWSVTRSVSTARTRFRTTSWYASRCCC